MADVIEIEGGGNIIRGPHFSAMRNRDGSWDIAQVGLEWKYFITVYPHEVGEFQQIAKLLGLTQGSL